MLKKTRKRTFSAEDICGNPTIPAESLGYQAALWLYFYFFSSLLNKGIISSVKSKREYEGQLKDFPMGAFYTGSNTPKP